MTAEIPTTSVSWYTCDCPWISSYCRDMHRAFANVPTYVLDMYREHGR